MNFNESDGIMTHHVHQNRQVFDPSQAELIKQKSTNSDSFGTKHSQLKDATGNGLNLHGVEPQKRLNSKPVEPSFRGWEPSGHKAMKSPACSAANSWSRC